MQNIVFPVVYLPVSLCPETQQEDRANPSTRLNLAGSFFAQGSGSSMWW